MIEKSMGQHMVEHPRLKYIFFGGKSSVGNTGLAGMTAIWAADNGKSTLFTSTNPAHSLSYAFGQSDFSKPTPVDGVPNLHAYKIEAKGTIENSRVEIQEKIQWFQKNAGIRTNVDDLIESAITYPTFREFAMFENMLDLMFTDQYEFYVFDSAPTTIVYRLTGMSHVYSLWVNKLVQNFEDPMRRHDRALTSKTKAENESLMDYLIGLSKKMGRAKELLTDDQLTTFYFATLPEPRPVAIISNLVNLLTEFDIPVGGVIVNLVIDEIRVVPSSPDYIKDRLAMQDKYLNEIEKKLNGIIRAILPPFETELRGVNALRRAADLLFKD